MGRSGFIVRFVDVVLILLFGFISISSIRETEVDLPLSQETPAPLPDSEEVLFVGIRSDGTYLVDGERLELRGANALHRFLTEQLEAMSPIPVKVRIRASHDTPMGFLLLAAQVCDALGVEKAFEVQLPLSSG